MKRNVVILLAVLLGASRLTAAELPGPPPSVVRNDAAAEEQKAKLVKFDLDFPGGTPGQLVAAISKASGHPLNAIIPREDEDIVLPELKMRHVNVKELFDALEISSQRTVLRSYGRLGPEQYISVGYSFGHQGIVDQDTVWSFRSTLPAEIPPQPREKTCSFYQLNPYLKDHSVESITTAIETGWKMLEISNPPKMRFHKDTGLLIAVGEPDQLNVIKHVLENLEQPKAPPPPPPPTPVPSKPDAQ